jgi:hypothetical protein
VRRHRRLLRLAISRLLVKDPTVRVGSRIQLASSLSAISTRAENGKDFANTQTAKKFATPIQTRAQYRLLERRRRRHVLLGPSELLERGPTVLAGTPTQLENTRSVISTPVDTGKNYARTPTEKKFPIFIRTQANYLHQERSKSNKILTVLVLCVGEIELGLIVVLTNTQQFLCRKLNC